MSKPGADPSSGISLGDALRLPKRHPACRQREARPGSRKKLTCSGHATNSRRYRDLGSTCLCRGRKSSIVSFAAGRQSRWSTRKKLTCSGHATNSRRYHDLGSTCLCRGRKPSIVSFAAGRQSRWSTCMERENLAGDGKGKGASGSNREAESTDAPERGGLPRSRSSPLRSGQPATGGTRYSMEGGSLL